MIVAVPGTSVRMLAFNKSDLACRETTEIDSTAEAVRPRNIKFWSGFILVVPAEIVSNWRHGIERFKLENDNSELFSK